MTSAELRKKYLEFFKGKGHAIIPSASLIPENDPTTLFTSSGMQPMVPYLLGEEHPVGTRITDSQKCFRTVDIDEVGDNRHTTFFEMLGNWSLGDYFKKEQIAWMFEFLTDILRLDPKNIYVTCFRGNTDLQLARDDESALLWKGLFKQKGIAATIVDFPERNGMQGGRIFYYGEDKNWWSRAGEPKKMPLGEPGGPDSEMFWDFGAERGMHEASQFASAPCHVNCDCGRFMEIGNNVFMQYQKVEGGFKLLPKQNVDFGGGLERMSAAVNNNPDVFTIPLFDKARKVIENVTGKLYQASTADTYAFRVLLDHLRAATFLIGDGVLPSNKDQGYYVRRLIRRVIRFGHTLGIKGIFCGTVAAAYVETYADAYPLLHDRREIIISAMTEEEEKFMATLEKGLKEFEKIFIKQNFISGEDAFILFSTYGFPLELSQELAEERGQHIDEEVFRLEFKKHQDLSRAGATQKFSGGLADHSEEVVRQHTATHLLQQALRDVLGNHICQKGSNITKERLRFDFTHPTKMTSAELQRVEDIINEQIRKDHPVHYEMLTVEEAKARGAIGLFDDKYAQLGNKIKVYFVGDYSKEICGGPHVEHTGLIGGIKIVKEEAVSAGIRRIKAVLV